MGATLETSIEALAGISERILGGALPWMLFLLHSGRPPLLNSLLLQGETPYFRFHLSQEGSPLLEWEDLQMDLVPGPRLLHIKEGRLLPGRGYP
ncbi:UNVERIFIED_CONTAM: hypothetical protein Sradi_1524800 [Sesamum radiatum]|uniref:Uncharacterized protein n=1 Tax=Sesamum radiatum TaxID=300843 RepID=A0AAW2UCC5_SESRA